MARFTAFLCLGFLVLAVSSQKGSRKVAKKDDGKIVGGEAATIENHPYQVSIQRNGQHFCGGSIISPRHILTAAHCLTGSPWSLEVVAGVTKLSEKAKDNIYSVKKFTVHPNYNPRTLDSDVGIIELNTSLKFNNKIRLTLVDHDEFSPDDKLVVTGWGVTKNGRLSDQLMKVEVNGITRAKCEERYKFSRNVIRENMICAGIDGVGGKDSCQGDSGGPAISKETKMQVGVVSWGKGCANGNYPGVYTNVAKFIYWMRSVTQYGL